LRQAATTPPDRVALVDGGRVVTEGTPGALKARLGDEVRLEVVLKPEVAHNGDFAQGARRLESFGRVIDLQRGRYAVFVPRQGVGGAVDDFWLAPPSLEDVYIHVVGQKLEEPA
jgi:ABC-type multidrug transport system ATPase subunit